MDALWSEFKWENIWFQQVPNCKEKDFRGWKNIGATFGIALSFGLLLSIFDVSSDFLTFWLFLKGDNYRKTVPSEDSLYVTGSFNCSKTGHFYSYQEKNITSYSFECRETNPVFAWVVGHLGLDPSSSSSPLPSFYQQQGTLVGLFGHPCLGYSLSDYCASGQVPRPLQHRHGVQADQPDGHRGRGSMGILSSVLPPVVHCFHKR